MGMTFRSLRVTLLLWNFWGIYFLWRGHHQLLKSPPRKASEFNGLFFSRVCVFNLALNTTLNQSAVTHVTHFSFQSVRSHQQQSNRSAQLSNFSHRLFLILCSEGEAREHGQMGVFSRTELHSASQQYPHPLQPPQNLDRDEHYTNPSFTTPQRAEWGVEGLWFTWRCLWEGWSCFDYLCSEQSLVKPQM